MKHIFVINGRGGCGKDTLCELCANHHAVMNISSITPIKELAKLGGWDGSKDPKSRKFLADLKQLFGEYNDLPNTYIVNKTCEFLNSDNEILFVHIREGAEISKFIESVRNSCKGENSIYKIGAMLVIRDTENYDYSALGNDADDNVNDFAYDYKFINNAHTLDELDSTFEAYLSKILTS